MLDRQADNQCEPGQESERVAQLLERISELEEDNANLRRLEETIRTNTHMFEALLRGSHEGILLLSPELTILRVIHSAIGQTEKEVRGESLRGYVHPEDHPLLESCCAGFFNGPSERRVIEIRARGPDGKWVWVEGQVTDMLDDPDVQAIVMNFRRISRPDGAVR
jgi:PAS domain S-box-containing protein